MPRDARAPDREAELLTAYVDGVAELAPEERRRVDARLARDPEARSEQAAVRAMLERLRELPAEGTEPDWAAMEQSIRQAVGDEVPRPWWRRWRWIAPAGTLLAAAAVLLVTWSRPAAIEAPVPRPIAAAEPRAHEAPPTDDLIALWLDGAAVDVELAAADALSDVLGDDALAGNALGDAELGVPEVDELDLLPSTNLAWVDHLDEDAVERAERWLARSKG